MNKARNSKPGCRIFVGNLAFDADKNDLRRLFKDAGSVLDVYTPFDKTKEGFKNRGFAFVEMGSEVEAQTAILMFDGKEGPGSRKLSVRSAQARN